MNWLSNPSLASSQVLAILLDSALKGSVVIALAAGAAWLLRRNSAAARHSVWSAAIAAQLLIPLMVLVLPTWRVPLIAAPAWVQPSAATQPAVDPAASPVLDFKSATRATPSDPLALEFAPNKTAANGSTGSITPANDAGAGTATQGAATAASTSLTPIAILATLWLLGCLAVLARLAAGTAVVSRLAGKGEHVIDEKWLGLMHRLAVTLGIKRPLTLLRGDALAVPVTWGIVYPVVLLPEDADTWPEERRRYVLVHEMAHVKRLDAFTQLVSQFVLAVHWYNPLVWIATAQMRRERENACDDYVLTHGTKPSLYASDLLELVREIGTDGHRASAPAFAALAMARRSEFEGRMLSILDPRLRRNGLTRNGVVMGLLGTLLVAAPLAAFSPFTPERTPPPSDLPESFRVSFHDADSTTPATPVRGVAQVPASMAPAPTSAATTIPAKRASTSSSIEGCEQRSLGTSTMTSINSHGDRPEEKTLRFVQRRPGYCVEVFLAGAVEFTDDERDIAGLGRGAHVRFHEVRPGSERELTITNDGGEQKRVYSVNDRSAAFDDSGRNWLASVILTLVRESAYDAPARVRRLDQQGGTARVLAEIDVIKSSGAKRAYYTALLDSGRTFDDATLTRILHRVQLDFDGSSGDLRSVLERIPTQSLQSSQSRMAFADAIASIDSDGDKSSLLVELVPIADRELLVRILEVALTIDSDGDKSNVLVTAAASVLTPKDQRLREGFFRAAETIESDGDLSSVLVTAVPFGHADSAIAEAVIRATRRLESDGDKSTVLVTLATQRLLTTQRVKDLYLEAARTIESDGDRTRVLRAAMPD